MINGDLILTDIFIRLLVHLCKLSWSQLKINKGCITYGGSSPLLHYKFIDGSVQRKKNG